MPLYAFYLVSTHYDQPKPLKELMNTSLDENCLDKDARRNERNCRLPRGLGRINLP